jgi:hypothetical protein
VGEALGHDVTQIIPGEYKGPRFKRGHKIRKQDIPEFLKIGKEHVFVMGLKPGIIHEDDVALRFGKAFSGKNIKTESPSEGKVTFYSKVNYPAAELRGIKNQNSTARGADTLCTDV